MTAPTSQESTSKKSTSKESTPKESTPSAPSASAPITATPASLFRRLAAMVYDSFLIMALCMAYGFIVLGVKYKLLDVPLAVGEKASIGFIGLLALLILIVCFFSFFWIREGQTTGMRAWRLKIINDSGHAPNKTQCIARCLLAPISLACFGLGYLWCLVDPHGMTIHDRMTRTRIALLPKDKK